MGLALELYIVLFKYGTCEVAIPLSSDFHVARLMLKCNFDKAGIPIEPQTLSGKVTRKRQNGRATHRRLSYPHQPTNTEFLLITYLVHALKLRAMTNAILHSVNDFF